MHVERIFAPEFAGTACLVGQRYGSHRNICAGRKCRALEFGHSGLCSGQQAFLAGAATDTLERYVGEERCGISIGRLAREWAVVAKQLQRPVDTIEDHILVSNPTHSAGRVRPALDPASPARLIVLRAARLAACGRDICERDVRDRAVPDPSN